MCVQAGTSMLALQGGYAVAWRVRAAPPEGESSSLSPPLWEPEKGPCPWEAGSVPYSCWSAHPVHILSADLSKVLHGSIRTLQELEVSYI